MSYPICVACGVQFAATDALPARCKICEDERQFIPTDGQQWTTQEELQPHHHNIIKLLEPGIIGIATHPRVAIGQRALLVQTPAGNILWDCISLLDYATEVVVRDAGGIAAIAISHPHFFGAMVEWSHTFHAPVYLHTAHHSWVMRSDPSIVFWEGETLQLGDGLTLIRCGGHFPGSTVLHVTAGAEGRGALLTGDTIHVAEDRSYVSFMYSYPNLIPLSAAAVEQIARAVAPFTFERIYGAWWERDVLSDAEAVVARSAARYIDAIQG